MSVAEQSTPTTPRERRRAETLAEILDAAWGLARDEGLAGISMRELGRRVGMRAQSLYAYVDSKDALYDLMFRQGYEQARELARSWPRSVTPGEGRAAFKQANREWAAFCVGDPVRYQLLFQRTIPGFEPSEESYALALEVLEQLGGFFASVGLDDPAAVDLWTAVSAGLTSQQLANDPGGDRWVRLMDEAVDMFCDHFDLLPEPGGNP